MKKLIILLLFVSINSSAQELKKHYIISTGSYGGNYYKTGQYISNKLNGNENIVFSIIESNGSNENIQNLKSRLADLAIIQRNVLLKHMYSESDWIKNIKVLLPLYEEKFVIYTHSKTPVPFRQFKEFIESEEKIKLGVSSKKGYSYEMFKTVSKFLNLNSSGIEIVEDHYVNLMPRFNSCEIDFLVSFSIPNYDLLDSDNCNIVYFDVENIELIESRIPHIYKTSFNDNTKHLTLGSWTFLIGLNNSISEIENSGISIIDSLIPMPGENDRMSKEISKSINLFKKNKNWNTKYFYGIPINTHLIEFLNYSNRIDIISPIGFLVLLLIIIYYLQKKNFLRYDNLLYAWYRFKHIIIGTFIVAILYTLSIEVLVFSESLFYKEMSIKSQLLDMPKQDLHFWVLIRNLTGNDLGVFPLSSLGKLMLSFSAYIMWIGTILLAISEYAFNQLTKKRKKGLMATNYKNHIIITGWSERARGLIKETINATSNYTLTPSKIVCIVPNSEKILEKDNFISSLHANHKISFISGDIREERVLIKSNIHSCKTVVLLAEDSSSAADEKTLLRALAISRFCRKKSMENNVIKPTHNDFHTFDVGKYIDSIYIIVEINNNKYQDDLKNADVNEIISSSNYCKNVITQCMLNHGVSKILEEVLQFNQYNEFYMIDLEKDENKHLRFKTFDDLLVPLRQQNILLIGIKIVYHDQNGNEIIDDHVISDLLKKDGLQREILINPASSNEISREADEDDKLIVFATNEKVIKKGVEKLKASFGRNGIKKFETGRIC